MISYLYLIRCKNNSIYTGITNNLEQRYLEHLSGKGSKYCRAFKVKQIVAAWSFEIEKNNLIALEKKIQKLTKEGKIKIIQEPKFIEVYTKELGLAVKPVAIDLALFITEICPCSKKGICKFHGTCEDCIRAHLTKGNPPKCFTIRPKWVMDVANNYRLQNTEVFEIWSKS